MTTVTRKGQITLPKRVRDALGLEPGSQVEFEVTADGVRLRKQVAPAIVGRWRGFLREEAGGRRSDEVIDELRGERENVG